MTESVMRARSVRIVRHRGNAGLYYATSPELKGLIVSSPSPEGLEEKIPAAIRDLYRACGVEVMVARADDPDDEWIAVNTAVARAALDRDGLGRH